MKRANLSFSLLSCISSGFSVLLAAIPVPAAVCNWTTSLSGLALSFAAHHRLEQSFTVGSAPQSFVLIPLVLVPSSLILSFCPCSSTPSPVPLFLFLCHPIPFAPIPSSFCPFPSSLHLVSPPTQSLPLWFPSLCSPSLALCPPVVSWSLHTETQLRDGNL